VSPDETLPIGAALDAWEPRPRPARTPMPGRYCSLEALDTALHADALHAAFALDVSGAGWTYLPYGPFPNVGAFRDWVAGMAGQDDPMFFTILDPERRAVGVASYLRIAPAIGSVEVGGIHYSPMLQRTRAATEAMYLLMRRAFDELGYRRYEWKCDALNAASRRAAERLGFVYEGTFRQATVYKRRNRDTAWYSIIDQEWPGLKAAFERWLDPANFDERGAQRRRLGDAR
jgi:RimJ/RimL family protein N-acetyltransferase